jgi:hypothetical protein
VLPPATNWYPKNSVPVTVDSTLHCIPFHRFKDNKNDHSDIDIDNYLSFHKILTWQVPADIELVNMSTQKNIITAQTKNYAMSINSQTNICGTNSEE